MGGGGGNGREEGKKVMGSTLPALVVKESLHSEKFALMRCQGVFSEGFQVEGRVWYSRQRQGPSGGIEW